MNKRIAIENTVRKYMKKTQYKVCGFKFHEAIKYEDGTQGNPGVEILTDKEMDFTPKFYKVFRRMEDRLMKKFGYEIVIA